MTTDELFNVEQFAPRYKSRLKKVNPMVLIVGPGPEGKRCRDCVHLRAYQQSTAWFKCALRKNTGGAATDHRALWEPCAKFEEKKGE